MHSLLVLSIKTCRVINEMGDIQFQQAMAELGVLTIAIH